ncbi:proto-oncogene serine/threonine-protein kinase mos-like [Haliotis rufescens]|uniref:proto-oncogene serine/threonine-protein kinase mos-like n=1 Tax=Haliotis rufescens TaxID=6454 RepID=UPI00201F92D0|nr:proto-oncogene serine/threonine-protein kinase mos-like [Haliotis rufescens]XP_048253051.1 proto-oncogene serine/threonine-protein kinase mos-like [Haliotis rufescens]
MKETELVQGRFSTVRYFNIGNKTVLEKALSCPQPIADAEKHILQQCAESEGAKNIVKIYNAFPAKGVTMFLEYCEEGNLNQYVSKRLFMKKHLNAADCRSFMTDIASGLQFLHNIDIIHANLLPENILVTSCSKPVYKIGGFGSAAGRQAGRNNRRDEEHGGLDGTEDACFLPPEEALDKKSDIFSLGAVTYALWSPQFVDDKLVAYYGGRRLAKMAGKIDLGHITDQGLRDIINEALKADIAGRPTAEEVCSMLNTGYSWWKILICGGVVAGVSIYGYTYFRNNT